MVSLNGDQEKETGLTGQPRQPLLGARSCGPKYGVVTGKPALTVKLLTSDHGLRINLSGGALADFDTPVVGMAALEVADR